MRVCAENWEGVRVRSVQVAAAQLKLLFASTTIERPSGVSSASEASCAASASSCASTPRRGIERRGLAVAERDRAGLVEQQHVDVARGLDRAAGGRDRRSPGSCDPCPRCRSPTAAPPIVVGIRQTSSATSTVSGHDRALARGRHGVERERQQRGRREQEHQRQRRQQDRERDLVRRALRASRLRPSRSCGRGSSRPGWLVTRTTSQSDSTRVPPVTDERSPPASRSTGADSPVMALSSTDATPSMTSPSPGMMSPASTSTRSPLRSCARAHGARGALAFAPSSSLLRVHLLAHPRSARGLRFAAAFGQRFGEVREQHREPQPDRDREHEAGRPSPIDARTRPRRRSASCRCCRRRRRTSPDCGHCTRGCSLRE